MNNSEVSVHLVMFLSVQKAIAKKKTYVGDPNFLFVIFHLYLVISYSGKFHENGMTFSRENKALLYIKSQMP